MEVISYIQGLSDSNDHFLFALLLADLIASLIDFSLGWINARFNKNVQFDSGMALYGIMKKMMYFIVLVFFMPVAFLVAPEAIAFSALVALYTAYLLTEISSILAHLDVAGADKNKSGEVFATFIKRVFKLGKEDRPAE